MNFNTSTFKKVVFLSLLFSIISISVSNAKAITYSPFIVENSFTETTLAETVALRPNGDIETQWNDWGTTPHYLYVDDDPDNPDSQYVVEKIRSNQYESFNFETVNISSVNITQIKVKVRFVQNGSGTPQIDLYFDGAYQGWKDLISDYNSSHEYLWTGLSGNQSDLDGLQVRFKSSLTGKDKGSNTLLAVEVYAYYIINQTILINSYEG